jgi:hypothetical protein
LLDVFFNTFCVDGKQRALNDVTNIFEMVIHRAPSQLSGSQEVIDMKLGDTLFLHQFGGRRDDLDSRGMDDALIPHPLSPTHDHVNSLFIGPLNNDCRFKSQELHQL